MQHDNVLNSSNKKHMLTNLKKSCPSPSGSEVSILQSYVLFTESKVVFSILNILVTHILTSLCTSKIGFEQ